MMSLKKYCLSLYLLKKKGIHMNQLPERLIDMADQMKVQHFSTNKSVLSKIKYGDEPIPPMMNEILFRILEEETLVNEFDRQIEAYTLPARPRKLSLPITQLPPLQYDVFLSCPRASLEKKFKRHTEFNEDLFQLMHQYADLSDAKRSTEFRAALREKTQTRFFGRVLEHETTELETFNRYVKELRTNLKEKTALNVLFPRPQRDLDKIKKTGHAPTIFEEDFRDILASKAYLIISPYPRLFTSAWIGLSIALSFQKLIIVITNNSNNDVPYVISKDMRKARNLIHKEVQKIDEIPAIYEFVNDQLLKFSA